MKMPKGFIPKYIKEKKLEDTITSFYMVKNKDYTNILFTKTTKDMDYIVKQTDPIYDFKTNEDVWDIPVQESIEKNYKYFKFTHEPHILRVKVEDTIDRITEHEYNSVFDLYLKSKGRYMITWDKKK